MIFRIPITRKLYNLELSRNQIISEYTSAEKLEIACINKPAFNEGAVGEFGIRKIFDSTLVQQNFTVESGIYWYDWTMYGESFCDVKRQRWWEPNHNELVLQGDDTNFQRHHRSLDTLLIWGLKPDGDTVTPLAFIDVAGLIAECYGLNKGPGIAANLQTLYQKRYLEILNDEWRQKFLKQ